MAGRIVELDTYPNEIEARFVEGILSGEGISVVVKPMGSGYGGFGATQWISHRVYVVEEDLERAKQILDETEPEHAAT